MAIDISEKKQKLLFFFKDREDSLRLGQINGHSNDTQFYIDSYIFYFILECLSTALKVEGPYDRLTEFFSLYIREKEIKAVHFDLIYLRDSINNEIKDDKSLPNLPSDFLECMRKSDLYGKLYYYKDDKFHLNIGNKNYTESLMDLYSIIHPGEDNYIKNFLSTIKLEMRRKRLEDDEDFGPITNLKRNEIKILIRTAATKDIARIIIEDYLKLDEPPEKFENIWTFLFLYHLKYCKDDLSEINFNNTILVGMSYHSISDYINYTPLRAYLTHHIFNTILEQNGLIISPFPITGLLTRYIKKSDKNYFKESPNLRDFIIPSLGDCFWLTESNNIKYFELLTSTPTSGRTMYDGIPSVLECKIGNNEGNIEKVDKFLPKWNQIDINKIKSNCWSSVSLEDIKLSIDSENLVDRIEDIRKTSTIEKPLRITQYYFWLKDLNCDIENILIDKNPKSANYIQSKYGLTPLEFKEIIVLHCSIGWFIAQSLLLRPRTQSKDDIRANAEIVSVLSSLNKYRKNQDDNYLNYANVIKNVKKYARKEKIKAQFLSKRRDSIEYKFLMKWLSEETNRFKKIQNEFFRIKKSSNAYYDNFPGIRAPKLNNCIKEIFEIAEKNIENIIGKESDLFKVNILEIATILAIPTTVWTFIPIILNAMGYSISEKSTLMISGLSFFAILIIYLKKKY